MPPRLPTQSLLLQDKQQILAPPPPLRATNSINCRVPFTGPETPGRALSIGSTVEGSGSLQGGSLDAGLVLVGVLRHLDLEQERPVQRVQHVGLEPAGGFDCYGI